jgi:hypothetical protein
MNLDIGSRKLLVANGNMQLAIIALLPTAFCQLVKFRQKELIRP